MVKASPGAILLLVFLSGAGCGKLTAMPIPTEQATLEVGGGAVVEEAPTEQATPKVGGGTVVEEVPTKQTTPTVEGGTVVEEVPTEQAALEIGGSAIVEKMDLHQLVTAADFILVGSIEEIHSEWNAEGTRIHTDVTLSVRKCLKGAARSSEVTIRFPGGQVGEMVQSSSTAPKFRVGEEVVVFLEYGEEDTLRVVGGFQGKFAVQEQKVVERDVPQESFLSQIGEIMRAAGISPGVCTGD